MFLESFEAIVLT